MRIDTDNITSSSENDEDYYDRVVPIFEEGDAEFEAFVERVPSISKTITTTGSNNNNSNLLVNKISTYMKTEGFFVDFFETKLTFLKSAPNSFFPILNRNKDDNDFFAPTYMTDTEIRKRFIKPTKTNPERYKESKLGLEFNYTPNKKDDLEAQYILTHRLLYGKLCQDNLMKSSKNNTNQKKELNLPINVYEGKTFIKRFCDIFSFFPCIMDELQEKFDNEQFLIKKIIVTLVSGLHKLLSSQGIPLTALPGETFETKNGLFYLFAEVRNNKPIKISYNIRWKNRDITLDGWASFDFSYKEKQDKMVINVDSYNKMVMRKRTVAVNLVRRNANQFKNLEKILKLDKIKKNEEKDVGNERIFEFNLPKEFLVEGIVETIDNKNIRLINISSFIFLKGFIYCAFIVFNYNENKDLFSSISGMVVKPILNAADELNTSHYYIGLVVHNSGFSEEPIKNKLNFLNFLKIKGLEKKDKSPDSSKRTSFDKIGKKEGEEIKVSSQEKNNQKEENKSNKSPTNSKSQDSITNSNKPPNLHLIPFPHEDMKQKTEEEKNVFIKSENKNNNVFEKVNLTNESIRIDPPKTVEPSTFLSTVDLIYKNYKTNDQFITCFSSNFINVIILGSWIKLNFYEINYSTGEISQIFLKLIENINLPSLNLDKGISIQESENVFFTLKEYKNAIGKFWENIKLPLPTDTRFREDLIWLIRYYAYTENYYIEESEEGKKDFDKKRNEALKSASKWKDLLEGYVLANIISKMK